MKSRQVKSRQHHLSQNIGLVVAGSAEPALPALVKEAVWKQKLGNGNRNRNRKRSKKLKQDNDCEAEAEINCLSVHDISHWRWVIIHAKNTFMRGSCPLKIATIMEPESHWVWLHKTL